MLEWLSVCGPVHYSESKCHWGVESYVGLARGILDALARG
jgi:hypothetical protein